MQIHLGVFIELPDLDAVEVMRRVNRALKAEFDVEPNDILMRHVTLSKGALGRVFAKPIDDKPAMSLAQEINPEHAELRRKRKEQEQQRTDELEETLRRRKANLTKAVE